MANEIKIAILRETDIVTARLAGRELAAKCGFSLTDQTLIATAISEVARNIVTYAQTGEVLISTVEEPDYRGITIIARDEGPGIQYPELAMRDGYSTTKSLGMGLPGAKRIMDDFILETAIGKGVTITMKKWTR